MADTPTEEKAEMSAEERAMMDEWAAMAEGGDTEEEQRCVAEASCFC